MIPLSFQPGELPCLELPALDLPAVDSDLPRGTTSDATDVQLPRAWDDDELEVSVELD